MKYINTDRKSEKRVVPDTNILVSGLLWTGPPHELIRMAEEGDIELYTSLQLRAGLNKILIKVVQHENIGLYIALRITDSKGNPIPGLRFRSAND